MKVHMVSVTRLMDSYLAEVAHGSLGVLCQKMAQDSQGTVCHLKSVRLIKVGMRQRVSRQVEELTLVVTVERDERNHTGVVTAA